MTTFNYLTATPEELQDAIANAIRKNQEVETIIQSFGVSFNPSLSIELKITAVIKLLSDMDPPTGARIAYNFQLLLGEFLANALVDVRQRALLPDPNKGAGLIVPGRG